MGAVGATDGSVLEKETEGDDSDSDGYLDAEAWGCDPTRLSLPKETEFLKKLVDPKLPTESEWEQHCLMGHIPFRNWCPVCIRARGKESDHRQAKKERMVPE